MRSSRSRRMVLAGLVVLAAMPVGRALAQETVSGTVVNIWEDPLPERGEPRLRHFLSTPRGELIPLRISRSDLQALGGAMAAGGRHVEVSGDWRAPGREPGATWERELDVRFLRPAAPPAGASPPPQGVPVMGAQPWITVLCRFSDYPTTEPHPLSWYQGLMGGAEPGADHYWRALSFDQANVSGSAALGWYDLPNPRSHYVDDGAGTANLTLLKEDCAAVADADVFFPDFVGINFQFNESLGNFSWGGGSYLNIDGQNRFYRVTWLADWADHVTYMHEMGHGFGLPHSSGPYGQVYDSNWDVMSGSWTNYDSFWGWLSPHTISYHKDMLGWIPAGRIYDAALSSSQTLTLHRLSDQAAGSDYLMARVPLIDGSYYTVEARRFDGYDTNLPAEAVIMHHVTDRAYVVDPDGNGNPDDSGARWLAGETFEDAANGVVVSIDSETADGFVVTITVTDPGHIELDPTSLDFVTLQGTDPVDQAFTIRNTGIGDLDWTASGDAAWLELAAGSGSTAAGGSTDVGVSVSTAELAPGMYSATVTVSGNADNSPQTLAVGLEVTAAPVLTLIAEPFDLEAVVDTDPPAREVVIRNDGGAGLEWSAISDVAWMSFARGSGTLAPGASETDTVSISVAGLAVGDYTGTLTFAGNATNSPQTLDATLSITEMPSLALTGTLDFEAWEDDSPDALDLTIQNDGDGTLNWTAAADESWVSLSPASGSTVPGPGESVEVTVDGSGLAPGTHTATITVSGNADDSPQTAEVTYVVTARPSLAAGDVADHLLGVRTTLSASDLDYLDEVGNGNGSFDVGDFRAWMQYEGLMSLVQPGGGEEVAP